MSRFYIPMIKGIKAIPDFSGVRELGESVLENCFWNMSSLTGNVEFPDLELIYGGHYALANSFRGTNISSVSFPQLTNLTGMLCFNYAFADCENLNSISFPKLEVIAGIGCFSYAFSDCKSITSASFPKLTTLSSQSSFSSVFCYCSNLISVNLPELKEMSGGQRVFNEVFRGCRLLSSISFPKLETINSNYCFSGAFRSCTSLVDVSFPALKSTSFGSSVQPFSAMLSGVNGCVVHFPSNLQSVIGSWTDVVNGFGGTNTSVLFDLPATE